MNSLEVLDFPRVREMLAANCRTPMGAERARRLGPFPSRRRAEDELDRLAEVVALESGPEPGAVADVRPLLERARSGGVLTGEELLAVGRAAAGLADCRRFLDRCRDLLRLTGPELESIAGDERLTAEVALALDETGVVVDSASAELAEVRRGLRGLRGRLVRRLEAMIAEHPDHFGERPTIRHERHVLPLRVEHRDKLHGVVHESSGTGHTLFVEPMATVEDQNRLEELRSREQEEVARILRALSARVADSAGGLERGLERFGRLDFLLAGRRFAEEFDCTRPELTTRRTRIAGGRHPILVRKKVAVVPLELDLPDEGNVLLISGPNAGGKTVALKTLGLFCLLAASGLFVPAGPGTQLPFYRRVYADIGDDQSLDSNLSSFTAHVGKLKTLLAEADSESLVLLDEVGASTAPEEGAALAIAVFEALHERGVRVVATSHLWALKLYVQDHVRMFNAAMGIEDNRPTYRLTLGLPGESSALEIAAGAGLPAALLDRARGHVGQGWVDLAGRLRGLERELDRARSARLGAEQDRAAAARLKAEYEAKLAAFRAESREQSERQVARQRRVLLEARREIENLVREIRESQAGREAIVRAKRAVEQRLQAADEEARLLSEAVEGGAAARVFNPGDTVESRSLRQRGRVVATDGDEVTVAFGSLRVRLRAEELAVVEPGPAGPGNGGFEPASAEPVGLPAARLNLLGRTREEALEQFAGYLAEVSAAGLREIRVLHGKGEGVLQRAVWAVLRRDSRVSGFRFAEAAEGGTGVTVVELRTGES